MWRPASRDTGPAGRLVRRAVVLSCLLVVVSIVFEPAVAIRASLSRFLGASIVQHCIRP